MKRKMSFLNYIKVLLVLAFMSLCVMSYHPYIYSVSKELVNTGEAVISPFAFYITILLILLFILSCVNTEKAFINRRLSIYIIYIILVLLSSFIIYSISPQQKVSGDLKALLTCFGAFFIGWHLCIDEKTVKKILLFYGVLVCVVVLFQIALNIGGFVILATYSTDGKNALGAMLAVSNVLFYGLAKSKNDKVYERVIALAFWIFSLVELLTIRARLATVSAIVVVSLMFWFSKERKKSSPFLFFFILLALLFLSIMLPDFIYDYIYNSFFLNKERDVTAGRTTINLRAFQILMNDPLIGNLYGKNLGIIVHNWMLKRLYEYGVLLSIPYVVLYIKMFVSMCEKLFKTYSDSFQVLGYAMVFSLFIISLGEPNMPFSPGTAMTPAYLFWGYSYQRLSLKRSQIRIRNRFTA